MTTTNNSWNGPDTPAVHDEHAVNALLVCNGFDEHEQEMLRPVLLELRALVPDAPPAPSPDLAALLALADDASATLPASSAVLGGNAAHGTGAAADTNAVSDIDAYRARRASAPGRKLPRRTALTAAVVVASLGVAAGAAAAADGDFLAHAHENISGFFTTLTNPQPAGKPVPAPERITGPTSRPTDPAGSPSPGSAPKPTAPGSTAATQTPPSLGGVLPQLPGHHQQDIPGLPGTAQTTLPSEIPGHVPTTVPATTVVPVPNQTKPGTEPELPGNGH